jgi:hypothetical protein
MPLSTYLANALANHVYRNTAYTSPPATYSALFTSSASLAAIQAGTLTNEVAGGAYARQAATFGAPSAGVVSNSTITYPTATAGWGTIRFVAEMDAATGGNVLSVTQLSSDVVISTGNQFQFNSGSLTASFS